MTITHRGLGLTIQESQTPDMVKCIDYEEHTIGKRAADILLECFLVTIKNMNCRDVILACYRWKLCRTF